jgi:hypothetical protein
VVFLRSKVRVALALIFHVDGDEAYRGVSILISWKLS